MAEKWTKIEREDNKIEYKVEDTVVIRRVDEERLQEEKLHVQEEIIRLQERITKINADLAKIVELEEKK